MGGMCDSKDFSSLSLPDTFSQIESQLGLSDIQFSTFLEIMMNATPDRQITLQELGEAFTKYRFGKEIETTKETPAKLLLANPIFKAREDTLDIYHLFSIGFLYCCGSLGQKVNDLFETYDFNGNGNLQSDRLEIVLKDIIEIAGTLMPAIKMNLRHAEASVFTNEETTRVLNHALRVIFRETEDITREDLMAALKGDAKYLNSPTLVREELGLKWTRFY